jgi:hypothetical protein
MTPPPFPVTSLALTVAAIKIASMVQEAVERALPRGALRTAHALDVTIGTQPGADSAAVQVRVQVVPDVTVPVSPDAVRIPLQ